MNLTFDSADFELVTTKAALAKWVKWCSEAKTIAADTETTGLDVFNDSLVGISLAVVQDGEIKSCYIPVGHHMSHGRQLHVVDVLTELAPIFENKNIGKVWHNALYDLLILAQPRYSIRVDNNHDTMFMAYALTGDQTPLGMDFLAKRYFNWDTIHFADVVTNRPGRKDFRDVPLREATAYAAEDTAITLAMAYAFQSALKKQDLWRVYTEDRKLIPVLRDMKLAGIKIDTLHLAKLEKPWKIEVAKLVEKAHKLAGREFNLNSPIEVPEILQERGHKLPKDEKTDRPSAKKEVLEYLNPDPLVDVILEYRKLSKLLSTYVVKLPKMVDEKSRIHCNFPMTRTSTGRGASNGPNLQNIPTRTEEGAQLRDAFIAEKGHKLLSADYSQIEYRILSHITQDPYLLHCYRSGIDLHAKMAADVLGGSWEDYNNKKDAERYKIRTAFKNVNFAVIYGAGPSKVARMSNIELHEAYNILDAHRELAPRVYTWKDETWEFAGKHKYTQTLFGRRIHVPRINSGDKKLAGHAERLAINGVVQGSAADLMRMAMVRVHDALNPDENILLTVHDELVLEVPDHRVNNVMQTVKIGMETAADEYVSWLVPIIAEIDVGKTWKEAKG